MCMVEMSLEHELAMYYREIATAIAFEFEINLRLLAMLRPGPHSRTGIPGSTRFSLSQASASIVQVLTPTFIDHP